jgi:long-subunit fatty acid transport protein
VVEDVVTAREPSRIEGRWQIPPGVRVAKRGAVVTLRAGTKRATLTLGGTQVGPLGVSRSWFTKSYGAKALGRTLLRSVDLAPGQSVTWRMEFRVK